MSGKRGSIPADLAPILERLRIHSEGWLETVKSLDVKFGHVVGGVSKIVEHATRVGRRWFRGMSSAVEAFH